MRGALNPYLHERVEWCGERSVVVVCAGGGGVCGNVSVCVCVVSLTLPVTHHGPDADVACAENKEHQSAFRALVRACRVCACTHSTMELL